MVHGGTERVGPPMNESHPRPTVSTIECRVRWWSVLDATVRSLADQSLTNRLGAAVDDVSRDPCYGESNNYKYILESYLFN